jgi:hypothetical protein
MKKPKLPLRWLLLFVRRESLKRLLRELNVLKFIVLDSGFNPQHGICLFVEDRDLVQILFPYWPEFSGSKAYPIHTKPQCSPEEEFMTCRSYWDPKTEYGQARRRLLGWLIETLEVELEH